MRLLILASLALFTTSSFASDDPTIIEGSDAHYLFELATDGNNPSSDPDKVDFLGGCFFTLKNLVLTRLFCEFSEGRINNPDRLVRIVQPFLTFAPFPGVSNPGNGEEGRALGIEYSCVRTQATRPPLSPTYRCELKDHYYRVRD